MKIVLVGGGKMVYFLARTFLSKGHSITIINREEEECRWLARHLKALIVLGDGSAPEILEEAEIDGAEAVLAVTPNDQDNLVICQLASRQFEVSRSLALVNDPDNEQVFKQLGIKALSTTRILAGLIEQKTGFFDELIQVIPVGHGLVNISEVQLPQTANVVGKALRDIHIPDDTLIITVIRKDIPIVPRGSTVLQAGDHLLVMTLPENLGPLLNLLTQTAG